MGLEKKVGNQQGKVLQMVLRILVFTIQAMESSLEIFSGREKLLNINF